jgi:uncharacterized membrane protein YadS
MFPLLAGPLGLSPREYGLWAGFALHEVVQAVGAAAAAGPVATESGTVAKLARVVLLAPAVMLLGLRSGRAAGERAVGVPWFVVGFLALVVLGSSGAVPPGAATLSRAAVPLMLAASVAALGLCTDLRLLRARGWRPMLLALVSSLFIATLALAGVLLI